MDPVNTEIDSKYHFGYVDIILYTICIVTVFIELHIIYKVLTTTP